MNKKTNFPSRRHLAHPTPLRLHNKPVVIFLTVTLSSRTFLLNNDLCHKALVAAWKRSEEWGVGYYMVMPDHVHLFCTPSKMEMSDLRSWIVYWKRLATKDCESLKGNWHNDYWDRQMRSARDYHEKKIYVENNPVRKGLVAESEKWPYQGIINNIMM